MADVNSPDVFIRQEQPGAIKSLFLDTLEKRRREFQSDYGRIIQELPGDFQSPLTLFEQIKKQKGDFGQLFLYDETFRRMQEEVRNNTQFQNTISQEQKARKFSNLRRLIFRSKDQLQIIYALEERNGAIVSDISIAAFHIGINPGEMNIHGINPHIVENILQCYTNNQQLPPEIDLSVDSVVQQNGPILPDVNSFPGDIWTALDMFPTGNSYLKIAKQQPARAHPKQRAPSIPVQENVLKEEKLNPFLERVNLILSLLGRSTLAGPEYTLTNERSRLMQQLQQKNISSLSLDEFVDVLRTYKNNIDRVARGIVHKIADPLYAVKTANGSIIFFTEGERGINTTPTCMIVLKPSKSDDILSGGVQIFFDTNNRDDDPRELEWHRGFNPAEDVKNNRYHVVNFRGHPNNLGTLYSIDPKSFTQEDSLGSLKRMIQNRAVRPQNTIWEDIY